MFHHQSVAGMVGHPAVLLTVVVVEREFQEVSPRNLLMRIVMVVDVLCVAVHVLHVSERTVSAPPHAVGVCSSLFAIAPDL